MRTYFTLLFPILLFWTSSCNDASTGNSNESEQTDNSASEKESSVDITAFSTQIASYISEINRFRADGLFDSLEKVNTALLTYLQEKSTTTPELLDIDLSSMDTAGMIILTSEDKKFRIYCWDTETGGTMRFFNSLIQYRTGKGSESVVLNDIAKTEEPGDFYREIYTVHAKTGNTYYLLTSRGIYSSRDIVEVIRAYAIENGKLNDSVKLFRTTRQQLNEITYTCDFFSNIDSNTGSQRNLIRLSDDKQTLFIPVVNDKDEVTDKSLIYKFDGNQFVFDKNAR